MCALIDANIVGEIFGETRPQAGEKFSEWLDKRGIPLVAGGRLLQELRNHTRFLRWFEEAQRGGRIRRIEDKVVDERTQELVKAHACESDDPHVIAAAQLGGARLLYSNDKALQQDFKNKDLIDHPRGKVYTTLKGSEFKPSHQRLLANRSLCARGGR